DARPDSAMGGASDAGAHGRHPASTPGGSMPGHPIGDSIVERRHHTNDAIYNGPERRQAER
ncbi:MAG TPA: hypothetical protein VFS40_09135, partial [Gemmatimonadales bacterium]|nr:hypothetical protein [Gemmatimonadales bacterium]